MREIKFRAWDTSRSVMFSSEELGRDQLQMSCDGNGFFNASPIDPRLTEYYSHLIPMQYTGLRDRNGKEIFEHDSFSYGNIPGKTADVEFFEGRFGYWYHGDFLSLSSLDMKKLEVIGNKHEAGQ